MTNPAMPMMVALLALAVLPGRLAAHQIKGALTELRFNPRSCVVEIVHRFHVHDVEHAATQILGHSVDLLHDPAPQRELAQHLAGDFALGAGTPSSATLSYIGEEIDGKYLWVYQEWLPSAPLPAQLWLRQSALQSIWPEQENQVNLLSRGAVRSLVFRGGDGWKSLPASALLSSLKCSTAAPKDGSK